MQRLRIDYKEIKRREKSSRKEVNKPRPLLLMILTKRQRELVQV